MGTYKVQTNERTIPERSILKQKHSYITVTLDLVNQWKTSFSLLTQYTAVNLQSAFGKRNALSYAFISPPPGGTSEIRSENDHDATEVSCSDPSSVCDWL